MSETRQAFLTGERAEFFAHDRRYVDTIFDDGESPLKHAHDIELRSSSFKWKYPLWYCSDIDAKDCTWFEMARAGVWYTDHITVEDSTIEAPKNFRRCHDVTLRNVDFVNAEETLWACSGVTLDNVSAHGDYLAMNCADVKADNLRLVGNYPFDGARNVEISNSRLISKDCFWNCENARVRIFLRRCRRARHDRQRVQSFVRHDSRRPYQRDDARSGENRSDGHDDRDSRRRITVGRIGGMTYDFDTPIDRSGTYSLKWEEAGDALPMWVADMDFQTAPVIREALRRRVEHGVFGYSIVPPEWNQAYVDWWGRRHGLAIDPDSLVFCTGVVPAISSMVRKLTTPNENVVIMTPVYNIFFNSILNNGCRVLESPLAYDGEGHYEIDWADFETKLADPQTTLMILCNPHNPIDRIWDCETLERIGELCWKHHVTVVSDEIHSDLIFHGKRHIPTASLSPEIAANVVTGISATKTFNLAGLAFSNIIIRDAALRARFKERDKLFGAVNPMSLTAAKAAYELGGAWHEALKEYLDGNFAFVKEFLTRELPEAVMYIPEATYLAWVDLSKCLPETTDLPDFFANRAGVLLEGGNGLFVGNAAGYVRLNLAMPRSIIETGLTRMVEAIRKERE